MPYPQLTCPLYRTLEYPISSSYSSSSSPVLYIGPQICPIPGSPVLYIGLQNTLSLVHTVHLAHLSFIQDPRYALSLALLSFIWILEYPIPFFQNVSITQLSLFNLFLHQFSRALVSLPGTRKRLYGKGIEFLPQTLIFQFLYLCNQMSYNLDISNY